MATSDQRKGGVIGGLILIFIGLAFLAVRFIDVPLFENWWALFILFPAVVVLVNAIRLWRRDGFTSDVAGHITGFSVLATVGSIFLLGLDMGTWWPLIPIAIGLALLLRAFARG